MNRPRRLVLAVVVLCAAALGVSACTSSSASSDEFHYTTMTAAGKLIPAGERKAAEDASGPMLDGGTFHLSQDAGHVRVINFFASWCGPCQVETPQFALLANQLKDKGVDFVGIDTKDYRSSAVSFVSRSKVDYPVVFDDEGRNQLVLGNIPGSLPFTVLVDKQNRVAAVYLQRLSPGDLTKPIAELLAEK